MRMIDRSTIEFAELSLSQILAYTLYPEKTRKIALDIFGSCEVDTEIIPSIKNYQTRQGNYERRIHYPFARIASIGNSQYTGSTVAVKQFIDNQITSKMDIGINTIEPANVEFHECSADEGSLKYTDIGDRILAITGYLYPVNRTHSKERVGTFRIIFYDVKHSLNYNQKLHITRGTFEYVFDEDLLDPLKRTNEITKSIPLSVGHLVMLVSYMVKMIENWEESLLEELLTKAVPCEIKEVHNNVSEKFR